MLVLRVACAVDGKPPCELQPLPQCALVPPALLALLPLVPFALVQFEHAPDLVSASSLGACVSRSQARLPPRLRLLLHFPNHCRSQQQLHRRVGREPRPPRPPSHHPPHHPPAPLPSRLLPLLPWLLRLLALAPLLLPSSF